MISLDAATTTIDDTTHLVIRFSDNPILAQIFNTNDPMLQYNHVPFDVFIGTLFSYIMSKNNCQFTCDQLFFADFGYTHIVPTNFNKYVHHTMKHLFKNVGVPPAIVVNFVGDKVQG